MLISKFPNIHWLKRQIHHQFQAPKGSKDVNLPFLGWPTVLLNTSATQAVREDIEGPFSIFMNQKGSSTVGTQQRQVTIKNNAYVVTNNKEVYDLIINNSCPTEVFNIHFGTQFLKDASYCLLHNQTNLLDNPFPSTPSILPQFGLKATWRSATFNQLTKQLMLLHKRPDSSAEAKEMALLAVFEYVLLTEQKEIAHLQQLSSLKNSTKKELVKRLHLAVDYIYAYYAQPIKLEELAQISCLSKYHFLRSFKQAFGIAPYQFIKRIRMQQAIHLLENSSISIQEIAFTIGIENASSLSRMLFQQTGKYPSSYRK
ncbi:helix-turn-helix domain-containing protein [Aureispira anguillae]|uniref:AraC family transcriptional regulator n=1 Tax=Aureispira anguillae TaxID=2864201 RepID=A0A916DUA5_9BACT|nr:AraC family transcriptional regulator [Aureispira anguillae]BDS12086.1 AraC family transcriptional regulator [Aureispira anguillae]